MEVKNLKAYLANIGLTVNDFCKIIDCSQAHMSQILSGKKRAGRRLAKDVSQATSGIITLETRMRKCDQKCQEAQNDQKNTSIV